MGDAIVLPSARRASTRSWPALAGRLGGLLLGAILLVAAAPKALDPLALAEQIRAEGVGGPAWLARGLALAVIALEAGLGTALVLGVRSRGVLVAATGLVVLFLASTGRAYWRDVQGILPQDAACGCFGNLIERTPGQAFWQDLLLLVPALALAWWGRPAAPIARWRGGTAIGVAGVAAALSLAAPGLPVDDLATRLSPGVAVGEICGGRDKQRVCLPAIAPEIAGDAWVILADLESEAFAAQVPALNQFARSAAAPPLVVLTTATSAEIRAFFWRAAPAFAIHEAPPALLRPLYRALPRSFRVERGRVVETSRGVAPVLLAAQAER
jgi:hypothetical protein